MKGLETEDWYVLLGVDPSASSFEINHAYKELCQLYREDSLASYSFFTRKEREHLLAKLEEAHATLMDEEKRFQYDRALAQRDVPPGETPFRGVRKTFQRVSTSRHFTQHALLTIRGELKEMASSNPVVQEILNRDVLSGKDLKAMRDELGVSLEAIAEMTRVRRVFLRALEDDEFEKVPSPMFLKSFLKAYAQCLGLDAEHVAGRYLKRLGDGPSGGSQPHLASVKLRKSIPSMDDGKQAEG
jgi:transcriptional regulator with XRE-family HTH domain